MTSTGRRNIGRWGSKRVSKGRKSKLQAPPSRSAPPPPRLKPLSKLPRISGNNVSKAQPLASKLGVSISEVNAGKKAADTAATKVAAATNAAAKDAAEKTWFCDKTKGLNPALRKKYGCDNPTQKPCKPGCVPRSRAAGKGGSRRRQRRRRRSRRRR